MRYLVVRLTQRLNLNWMFEQSDTWKLVSYSALPFIILNYIKLLLVDFAFAEGPQKSPRL